MSENIKLRTLKSIHNITLYAKDVSLRKIDEIIISTHNSSPMLMELYSQKFFYEVIKQLQAKKKIYALYSVDLQKMKDEFEADIDDKDIALSSEDKMFKNTLSSTVTSLGILMKKVDIKIEDIENKIGENHDEVNKDSANTVYQY